MSGPCAEARRRGLLPDPRRGVAVLQHPGDYRCQWPPCPPGACHARSLDSLGFSLAPLLYMGAAANLRGRSPCAFRVAGIPGRYLLPPTPNRSALRPSRTSPLTNRALFARRRALPPGRLSPRRGALTPGAVQGRLFWRGPSEASS